MLCGYPPFHGETDGEVLAKVKIGKFSFPDSEWRDISQDAKDLLNKMLTYNANDRPTAEACLNHCWLKALAPGAKPDAAQTRSLIPTLRNFRAQTKLKKVALTVVASQVNESDMDNLRKTFQALDTNGDGALTFVEIAEGMSSIGLKPPADLDALLADLDSDGSGVVDYTEFLAATIDRRLYLQENVLWQAFRVFDCDGDGKITQAELRQVLNGGNIKDVVTEAAVKAMVSEVDLNGDGEVDFDEFLAMMRKGASLPAATFV
jgi:calcium-dependent protein kinase